jgi:hypothetical protein
MAAGCSSSDDHPLLTHHPDASVDAALDAALSGCSTLHEFSCVVTVTCDGKDTLVNIPSLCDGGSTASTIEAKARDQAAAGIACTDGATYVATCTTNPTAFTCPTGDELEAATVCIPGTTYDISTAEICGHLPANAGACSVACDRAALYAFATSGYHIEPCTSTDGVVFEVIAAPMTGDGKR